MFGRINLEIATINVMWPNILSGMAMACIFVPLTTASMGSLPNEEMGNAAGIFNLARNIGGSIGISLTTTLVARGTQAHQALMVGHLSPFRPEFQQYLQEAGRRAQPVQRSRQRPAASLRAALRHDATAGQPLRLCRYVSPVGAVVPAAAFPWCSC